MQKTDSVAEFLARGGKITKCAPGTQEAQKEASRAHRARVRTLETDGAIRDTSEDKYYNVSVQAAECGMSVHEYLNSPGRWPEGE